MDQGLRNFISSQKSLVLDTKIPGSKKQKSTTPKAGKDMMERPLEADPYKRFANSVIKDLPSKKDLVEKIQQFIDSEEAKL